MRLQNKVSLLTGFDSEIGRAIAVAFAREGSKIVGSCRSGEKGQETLRSVQQAGGAGVLVEGDLSKPGTFENLVQKAVQEFGRLDILVNYGAARRIVGTIMDITDEDFNEEMTADLKNVIVLSRCAIPAMTQNGGGSIVNLSSIAAQGVAGRALRSATKAALASLTVAMALDHGAQNVRVNAVLLGPTLTTEMLRRPEQLKATTADAVLKRLHTPEDVGAAVLFLASDEAKSITGALLPLDAGRSLPKF
jgi:NAD(P)-dependent dehydrogenase (short-subunit alcohol dehydrogenase family)